MIVSFYETVKLFLNYFISELFFSATSPLLEALKHSRKADERIGLALQLAFNQKEHRFNPRIRAS